MNRIKTYETYFERLNILMQDIENEFKNRHELGYLDGVLFHLYSRTKRNFQISQMILKSNIPNNYLEIIVPTRMLLESYLHTKYLRVNLQNQYKNKDVLESEYKQHAEYQQYRVARNLNELKSEGHEISEQNLMIIKEWYEGKKVKRVNNLENLKMLSKEVKEFNLYAEIYTVLSNFTHYSPSTLSLYGTSSDGAFSFGKFTYNERIDMMLRRHVIAMVLGTVRNLMLCFKLMNFMREKFVPLERDWRIIEGINVK